MGKRFLLQRLFLFILDPAINCTFRVVLVGIGVQVLLLPILNVAFYLDLRRSALFLTALFLFINVSASWMSIRLGPHYFGFGFALATTLTNLVGLIHLNRKMNGLAYETFMLQP